MPNLADRCRACAEQPLPRGLNIPAVLRGVIQASILRRSCGEVAGRLYDRYRLAIADEQQKAASCRREAEAWTIRAKYHEEAADALNEALARLGTQGDKRW